MTQKRKARSLLAALLAVLLLLAALPLSAYATAAPAADVSLTVALDNYNSFDAAVAALSNPPDLATVTTLTITGNFNGDRAWASFDSGYLANYFPNLDTLDMFRYSGTYSNYAFAPSYQSNPVKIRRIRLPAGVNLSQSMFLNCPNLTTLVCGDGAFEDGVINLTGAAGYGRSAFGNCTAITQVRLPDNINIPDYMFSDCIRLNGLTFAGSSLAAPSVGLDAFSGVPSNGTLTYPAGATGYDTFGAPALNGWTRVAVDPPAPPDPVDPVAPTPAPPAAEGTPHVCDFGNWQHSNEHHWKRCSCMALSDYAPHVFNSARVCTVCGYGARPKKVNPPTGVYDSYMPRLA